MHFLERASTGDISPHQLAEALREQEDLGLFDDKVQYRAETGISVTFRTLAEWMIERARRVGASTAVCDLARYIASDSAPYTQFLILAGVTMSEDMSLSDGIMLRPFSALPLSVWKEKILERFGQSLAAAYRPTAFLQRSRWFRREHLSRGVKRSRIESSLSQQLEDVPLLITALGPFAPLILGAWDEAEDWVPDLNRGGFASIPEPISMGGYCKDIAADPKELRALHSHWLHRTENERKHIRITLSRLNSALRHREPVNSAIDLGVAMEALFLANRGSDRGELGLTLRLRVARYLGTDAVSRREIAKLFSDLYALRSSAVHTGRLHRSLGYFDAQELLDRGYQLVAKATRMIIRDGEPDWDNMIFD